MTFLRIVLGLHAETAAVQVHPDSLVIAFCWIGTPRSLRNAAAEAEASNLRRMTATWKPSHHEPFASTKAVIENDAPQVESTGADITSLANHIAPSDAELAWVHFLAFGAERKCLTAAINMKSFMWTAMKQRTAIII